MRNGARDGTEPAASGDDVAGALTNLSYSRFGKPVSYPAPPRQGPSDQPGRIMFLLK